MTCGSEAHAVKAKADSAKSHENFMIIIQNADPASECLRTAMVAIRQNLSGGDEDAHGTRHRVNRGILPILCRRRSGEIQTPIRSRASSAHPPDLFTAQRSPSRTRRMPLCIDLLRGARRFSFTMFYRPTF